MSYGHILFTINTVNNVCVWQLSIVFTSIYVSVGPFTTCDFYVIEHIFCCTFIPPYFVIFSLIYSVFVELLPGLPASALGFIFFKSGRYI